MRLSIMQPYFIPYAGYFRLLSMTDLFVIYDDVQFIKGGYIHRNQLTRTDGNKDWITLPIKRPHLGSKINGMEWQPDSDNLWIEERNRFEVFQEEDYPNNFLRFFVYYLQKANRRMEYVYRTPLDFIVKSLEAACYELQIGSETPLKPNMIYSSALPIPVELKGQDRVLWICEHFKAKEYVNAPGGRHLYDEEEFNSRNIKLRFLSDYPDKTSILERLCFENPQQVRKEIDAFSFFQ